MKILEVGEMTARLRIVDPTESILIGDRKLKLKLKLQTKTCKAKNCKL